MAYPSPPAGAPGPFPPPPARRGRFNTFARRAAYAGAVLAGLAAVTPVLAAAARADDDARRREDLAVSHATFTLAAIEPGQPYSLPHRFLFAGTEEVTVAGVTWRRGSDYALDYDAGVLTVLAPPPYAGALTIAYDYLPFFQEEPEGAPGTKPGEAEALAAAEAEEAGSTLDITGSKTFTVTAGNEEAADFDQSLRLKVQGNVGDVKVTGDITDQDLPVEEGGATEPLEAVDKVSVRVEGRHLAGTFGDYDLAESGRRFAAYERRLTGVKAEAFYPSWTANAYAARARGRFATNEFYGEDGVQGPYQLNARDDENIVILANTERVWVNGVAMKAGENNDYVVDYDLATLTFTVRRSITAQDRVVVDFQYTTDEYRRSLYGGDVAGHFAGDAVNVGALYVQEDDDRDHDLFGLTDFEKYRLLPLVGDDPTRARVPARDENGDILYEYVGEGKGDYLRSWDAETGRYNYRYVGAGNGDYTPRMILLPLPKRQNLFDVTTTFAPTRLITVAAEGASSFYDANTFSPLAEGDNEGLAGTTTTTVRLDALEPLRRVGELEVSHLVEARDGTFRAMGREDDVAFLEDWDLQDENAGLTRAPAYNLYATTLTESPTPGVTFTASSGAVNQRFWGTSAGGYRNQYGKRLAGAVTLEPAALPHVAYDYDYVRRWGERLVPPPTEGGPAVPSLVSRDENTRREQNGLVSYGVGRFVPYVRVYDRKRRADYATDGVADAGTLDQELEVGTSVKPLPACDVRFGHTLGRGEEVRDHAFAPSYRSRTESGTASYDVPDLLNVSLEYTQLHKDYALATDDDVTSDLSLVNVLYTPWARALVTSVRYELVNGRDWEKEEYFEVASDGDGEYRRVPDPKNPGRYIYIYDPEDPDAIYLKKYRNTGRTHRVEEPDLTADVALSPYAFNDARPAGSRREPWLDAASLDLYVHAENSTTTARRLKAALLQNLLDPSALDSAFEQRYTVKILPVNPHLTVTGRYTKKDELDRTIAPREVRNRKTSRYGEVNTQPVAGVNVRLDAERVREYERVAEENVPQPETTNATEMIYGLEPAVDPAPPLTLKVRSELSRRNEDYNGAPTRIKGLKIKPEGIYRLPESGVVDVWYERARNDVTGYLGSETLLFRLPGVTHTWEARVDKGVGKYVTIILTYDGEKKPDNEPTRHRGRVDVNIYF